MGSFCESEYLGDWSQRPKKNTSVCTLGISAILFCYAWCFLHNLCKYLVAEVRGEVYDTLNGRCVFGDVAEGEKTTWACMKCRICFTSN